MSVSITRNEVFLDSPLVHFFPAVKITACLPGQESIYDQNNARLPGLHDSTQSLSLATTTSTSHNTLKPSPVLIAGFFRKHIRQDNERM